MNTSNMGSYSQWVCPKCKGALRIENGNYLCGTCQPHFGGKCGIPDFRFSDYDSENQLLLAREYIESWDKLTYEDMVRMRYSGLRERALAAGRNADEFRMWDLDEKSHLASYKTRGKRHLHMLAETLKRSGQAEHVGRLVDVGCGWGRDLLHLSTLADEVIGVDVSTFSLLLARKLLEEHSVSNVTLVLADGQFLPLPSESIDGINSSATIEHFPAPGDFLCECSRCLRKPGWIFLYYPNRFSALPETHTGIWGLGFWSEKTQREIVRKKTGGEWDTTLFSRSSFRRLLEHSCDYDRVEITGMPHGIEQFVCTSKFAEMYPGLAQVVRRVLPGFRVIPGVDRLVCFFAPVHFVIISRYREGGARKFACLGAEQVLCEVPTRERTNAALRQESGQSHPRDHLLVHRQQMHDKKAATVRKNKSKDACSGFFSGYGTPWVVSYPFLWNRNRYIRKIALQSIQLMARICICCFIVICDSFIQNV